MAIVNGSLELGYKNLAWFTANPTLVLNEGQIVYLEQTGTYKIGDGVSALSVLSFLGISSETQTLQNVTDLWNTTTNNIEANAFVKSGGLATEFLKADGSVDSNTYLTSSDLTNLVPYTGATNDVDLGEKELTTGKLWLYDAVGGPTEKGSLHYADEALHFENSDGETLLYIEPGFMQIHKDGAIQSNFFVTNLTANRDHYLPNASGTIALQEYVSANYVPTSRTITINGITKDLSANQDWTIGSSTGVRTPYTFIATAGQTTFTTVGYTVGQIDVYYNGSKQIPSEYTATNGTTVVFATGKLAGDEIEIVVWNVSDVASTLTLDTTGFGEDKTFNATTNTLTIDKYNWMDLARGYTVEPTLFTTTSTYEVYEYEYSTSTLYRKIMNDGSVDAFYSESGLINLLCSKKIIL